MGKINAQGEPTAYGQEGIVQSADDRLHQVDPSRNLDGSAVDGLESDERDDLKGAEARDHVASAEDAGGIHVQPGAQEEMDAQRERGERAPLGQAAYVDPDSDQAQGNDEGGASSPGSSSQTSPESPVKSESRKSGTGSKPARTTASHSSGTRG